MNRQYPPDMLHRLPWETTTIEDHADLARLFQELHDQGDINYDEALKKELSRPAHYFRHVSSAATLDELCEYCLRLQLLQENGLAVITHRLKSRIDFHREVLNNKNKRHE